jgi:hypothetical protein
MVIRAQIITTGSLREKCQLCCIAQVCRNLIVLVVVLVVDVPVLDCEDADENEHEMKTNFE